MIEYWLIFNFWWLAMESIIDFRWSVLYDRLSICKYRLLILNNYWGQLMLCVETQDNSVLINTLFTNALQIYLILLTLQECRSLVQFVYHPIITTYSHNQLTELLMIGYQVDNWSIFVLYNQLLNYKYRWSIVDNYRGQLMFCLILFSSNKAITDLPVWVSQKCCWNVLRRIFKYIQNEKKRMIWVFHNYYFSSHLLIYTTYCYTKYYL